MVYVRELGFGLSDKKGGKLWKWGLGTTFYVLWACRGGYRGGVWVFLFFEWEESILFYLDDWLRLYICLERVWMIFEKVGIKVKILIFNINKGLWWAKVKILGLFRDQEQGDFFFLSANFLWSRRDFQKIRAAFQGWATLFNTRAHFLRSRQTFHDIGAFWGLRFFKIWRAF